MAGPQVGEAPRWCAGCGWYAYGGAPGCAACARLVDALSADAWAECVRRWGAEGDEAGLAGMIADEPDRHDWRVVDAALDRLGCPGCGGPLGRGPVGCAPCDRAHGYRYAAVEADRPGVPPGNEHAVRVNVSVVRRPGTVSVGELLVRRLTLPFLLVGLLPSTGQAQRLGALVRGAPSARREETARRAVEELFGRG